MQVWVKGASLKTSTDFTFGFGTTSLPPCSCDGACALWLEVVIHCFVERVPCHKACLVGPIQSLPILSPSVGDVCLGGQWVDERAGCLS